MKRLFSAMLIFIAGCGTIQISGDTKIIELPGMSKNQIYQKAMQWLTYKFVSGKAVIDYKDPASGRLIAKGTLAIAQPMGSHADVFMVATIDAINGKTKILVEPAECAAVAPNGARYPCNAMYITPAGLKEIKIKPEEFTEEYKLYMTGGRAPAWDGK